jgi:Enoyl-CoA hydratase/isomerase
VIVISVQAPRQRSGSTSDPVAEAGSLQPHATMDCVAGNLQTEVGVGMVAGGGPMARLPRLMGRQRALEVLLSSSDVRGDEAERLGYVNRALPDAELDDFVDALAARIASFDKWAIVNTKHLVNEASLPPDVEIRAGWDACLTSLNRAAVQDRIVGLLAHGFQERGELEEQLGPWLGHPAPGPDG